MMHEMLRAFLHGEASCFVGMPAFSTGMNVRDIQNALYIRFPHLLTGLLQSADRMGRDISHPSSILTFVSSLLRTPSTWSTAVLVPPENAARINVSPGRRPRTSIRHVKDANGPLGILSSLGQEEATML
ncbi:hypothetical protein K437DRAFT_75371 [Tilletiaria anomala UBC 951]|uniref:Helicase C-terminal domain-containing protein n=1 Tax=Tilletiaria anomala (strain ATCC 24038 / CBS 436.72 / UBC 951) TaxID=1037660 RepID=A0A066VAI0_TILAU|nr:uncharacterized protein K437DRAFT_75371 [Tilletiaria anomala UBC 951]KDN35605.1 hypothetical protein K437DRAFT_75371 [Tilletiaria anomala UBC 951]